MEIYRSDPLCLTEEKAIIFNNTYVFVLHTMLLDINVLARKCKYVLFTSTRNILCTLRKQ